MDTKFTIKISPETLRFIQINRKENIEKLALQDNKSPNIDLKTAITQIAGWQTAIEKIPSWANNSNILYPQHLSLEQCSSEATAKYKTQLMQGESFADLTGGFGIDFSFISQKFLTSIYVEHQQELCELAKHNFCVLKLANINVVNDDSISYLTDMPPVNSIYIDPARRNANGGRIVAIADCEPNVIDIEELLLSKASQVLIKLSPMLDLSKALDELKNVFEAHVLSVNNECKELLLLLHKKEDAIDTSYNIPIHCVNLQKQTTQHFVFTRKEEQESPCEYTDKIGQYLYEPNASLLKAGAFRRIAYIYNVKKLHPNSHLYTSDSLVANFPGRIFHITGHSSFNKKEIKLLLYDLKKGNLTIRNFPSSVIELRKRINLKDGGDIYLFATQMNDGSKILIRCKKTNEHT
ncbi:MAG: SAM-dependent methyltransferase [Bacteroidaceae bacterium]